MGSDTEARDPRAIKIKCCVCVGPYLMGQQVRTKTMTPHFDETTRAGGNPLRCDGGLVPYWVHKRVHAWAVPLLEELERLRAIVNAIESRRPRDPPRIIRPRAKHLILVRSESDPL